MMTKQGRRLGQLAGPQRTASCTLDGASARVEALLAHIKTEDLPSTEEHQHQHQHQEEAAEDLPRSSDTTTHRPTTKEAEEE